MKVIVIALGVLSVMFHPFTGSVVQMFVVSAWDFIIVTAGAWILVGFLAALVFLFGTEYAKWSLKQTKTAPRASKKAHKGKADTALGNFIV